MTYWIEVSKTLIGTFAGAFLGLGSALSVAWIHRHRENIVAGNLAMFTIGQYVSTIRIIRRHMQEEVRRHAGAPVPPWYVARPTQHSFNELAKFDFSDLGFLISDDPNLLPTLAYVERLYFTFVDSINAHSDCMARIQQKMEEGGLRFGATITVDKAEEIIGPNLTAKGNALTSSILKAMVDDEAEYLAAADRLYDSMRKYRWRWEKVTKIDPEPISGRLANPGQEKSTAKNDS